MFRTVEVYKPAGAGWPVGTFRWNWLDARYGSESRVREDFVTVLRVPEPTDREVAIAPLDVLQRLVPARPAAPRSDGGLVLVEHHNQQMEWNSIGEEAFPRVARIVAGLLGERPPR